MFVLWLALVVAFLALEIHTQQFYGLIVALGAAAAAITDLAGGSLWFQGLLFAIVALVAWGALRPLARHRFEREVPVTQFRGVAASADGMVGQRAITLDTVADEHHPGHVMLAGERWLAVADTREPLPAQLPVTVVAVRGTTLLVHPTT